MDAIYCGILYYSAELEDAIVEMIELRDALHTALRSSIGFVKLSVTELPEDGLGPDTDM